jgi:hypothetical protein
MRFVFVVVLLAGCMPSPLFARAGERLGVHGKHLHLVSVDEMGGRDVYVFCRSERTHDVGNLIPIGERSFDGACITYVCPAGDDGRRCD